jgi:hypothetical protein
MFPQKRLAPSHPMLPPPLSFLFLLLGTTAVHGVNWLPCSHMLTWRFQTSPQQLHWRSCDTQAYSTITHTACNGAQVQPVNTSNRRRQALHIAAGTPAPPRLWRMRGRAIRQGDSPAAGSPRRGRLAALKVAARLPAVHVGFEALRGVATAVAVHGANRGMRHLAQQRD